MDFQRQECVIQTERHKSLLLRAGGETPLLPASLLLSRLISLISFFPVPLLYLESLPYSCPLPSPLTSTSVFSSVFIFLSSPLLCYLLLSKLATSNPLFFPHISCLISAPPFSYLKRFASLSSGAHVELHNMWSCIMCGFPWEISKWGCTMYHFSIDTQC